jgi:hypothetical protein
MRSFSICEASTKANTRLRIHMREIREQKSIDLTLLSTLPTSRAHVHTQPIFLQDLLLSRTLAHNWQITYYYTEENGRTDGHTSSHVTKDSPLTCALPNR